MSWLSPRTVRGWFVLIVLGALLLSQIVSLGLLASQQTFLRSALHEAEALSRTAGIVSLAKGVDEKTRETIQLTASSPTFLVQFDREPLVASKDRNPALSAALAVRLEAKSEKVRVAWDAATGHLVTTIVRHADDNRTVIITRSGKHVTGIPRLRDLPPEPPVPPPFTETETISPMSNRLDISIEMEPALWLNVTAVPPTAPSMMLPLILAGALAALLVAIAAIWAAGRIARPIAGERS